MILEPKKDSELMTDEIFGPIMPIYPFKDTSEVMKMVKSKDKPLAIYYFGRPGTPCMMRLEKETSSGCFMTNEMQTQFFSNYVGFGGVGSSGYGRHGGFEGFKNFSNRKGIIYKSPNPESVNKYLAPPFTESQ